MSLFLNFNPARIIIILGVVVSIVMVSAIWFGYFYQPNAQETRCDEIPTGSVVLVSGFEYYLGPNGNLMPGDGNQFLAQKLVDCSHRFSAVITQQAILEALVSLGVLSGEKLNGVVPVHLMHEHRPDVPVRTLQSLRCAVARLSPVPDELVILAHDKHQMRAVQDLRSIFDGAIIEWRVTDAPYANEKLLNPFYWAVRELFIARPAEAFLRWAGQRPHLSTLTKMSVTLLGGFDCPTRVKIKQKIDLNRVCS